MNKEGGRSNNSTRNEYSDRLNFEKAIDRYQGNQINKVPDDLYQSFNKHFTSQNFPAADEVKQLPANERGRRGSTTHRMLWDALAITGYSDYYEDSNLIGHNYWDWVLPNIKHLVEAMMSIYDKTQRVWNSIPNKERSSSLGTQYRLFKILELLGHECHFDEFKIAEGDSLDLHEQYWKLMCEQANDVSIYFIPTRV